MKVRRQAGRHLYIGWSNGDKRKQDRQADRHTQTDRTEIKRDRNEEDSHVHISQTDIDPLQKIKIKIKINERQENDMQADTIMTLTET